MSVAPTEGLSAEMSGYLPVHCVHQLIKMRTFRKHGFSIKVSTYNGTIIMTYNRSARILTLIRQCEYKFIS